MTHGAAGTSIDCNLPFLEQRQYLHGTTLYTALTQELPADATVCFRIRRIIRGGTIRIWRGPTAGSIVDPAATLQWNVAGASALVVVEEVRDVAPVSRVAYPEYLIEQRAQVSGTLASYDGPSPFDFVATAVPLFKRLLAAQGYMGPGGAWMFTRLDSRAARPAFQNMALLLQHVLPNRVAKCRIDLDGEISADIYFSWVANPEKDS